MFHEELMQTIKSVMEQGLSGKALTAVLTANINPEEICESDDMLVTDAYFPFCIMRPGKKRSLMQNGSIFWNV